MVPKCVFAALIENHFLLIMKNTCLRVLVCFVCFSVFCVHNLAYFGDHQGAQYCDHRRAEMGGGRSHRGGGYFFFPLPVGDRSSRRFRTFPVNASFRSFMFRWGFTVWTRCGSRILRSLPLPLSLLLHQFVNLSPRLITCSLPLICVLGFR